jgi:hypothetical protein
VAMGVSPGGMGRGSSPAPNKASPGGMNPMR